MFMEYLEKYAFPLLVSFALHALIVLTMLKQWSPEHKKMEVKVPSYVKAQLVKLEDVSKQQKKSENKPKVVDLTKKRQEQEQQKKIAEQKKQRELKLKQDAEKKRQAEADKKKKEAELKAKEESDKKRQEQLRKQREAEAFNKALAQEQSALAEESYAVAAQSYMSAISQRIEQNWSRPPSARNGMQCELMIKLVPTGRVINVDLIKSSGSDLFDRSAIQAVNKAEVFPEIKNMKPEVFERYYRELKLVFRPQDLRQ